MRLSVSGSQQAFLLPAWRIIPHKCAKLWIFLFLHNYLMDFLNIKSRNRSAASRYKEKNTKTTRP